MKEPPKGQVLQTHAQLCTRYQIPGVYYIKELRAERGCTLVFPVCTVVRSSCVQSVQSTNEYKNGCGGGGGRVYGTTYY